ncbi:MAG: hypothetical protein ACT4P7_04745 [Gemmatimonadaceae bacterium]
MRLTDDELRDVLARAEEIQRASRHGDEVKAELEAVIGAAEEMGLARTAVERALRERLDLPPAPPEVGSLTFARSADDKFYVAEVVSRSGDDVRVRFLRGSEQLVALDAVRPCSFNPGERVVCDWPWWGPWTCNVMAYDPVKRRVKVNDGWGTARTFPIAEVWLPPAKAGAGERHRRVLATLIAGAGLGALVGSIITAWLMR